MLVAAGSTMKCPHCNDTKDGTFPGIGVRCGACRKTFYAAKNGTGYRSAPWIPWLAATVVPIVAIGIIWGIVRFNVAGDYGQVANILFNCITVLIIAFAIWRFSTVPEV